MKTVNANSKIGGRSFLRARRTWHVASLPSATILVVLLATSEAKAHRSPSNCNGINLEMSLYAFRLDGSMANTVTNGEKVIYVVQAQNDSQLPTQSGNSPSCDVTCAKFILQIPDANGNPGPAIVLATNVNLPFGTPPFALGAITSTVTVASGGSVAQAIAQVSGVGHDLTIPGCTSDGVCETNECDPHLAFVQHSVSLYILKPGISISSSVSNVTNLQGEVTFVVSGVVTNSGDEVLSDISIVSDEATGKMPIKTISSLSPGASVEFSGTCIISSNRCPFFANRVTATATGESTRASLYSSASNPVSVIPGLTMLPPKLRGDGGMDLHINCEPGWTYIIEASSDFVNWTSIGEATASSNTITMTDENAWRFEARFYRAKAVCQP